MNISIKGTNLSLSPSVKDYVKEKIGNLEKYIGALEAKVELERDRHHHHRAKFVLGLGLRIAEFANTTGRAACG